MNKRDDVRFGEGDENEKLSGALVVFYGLPSIPIKLCLAQSGWFYQRWPAASMFPPMTADCMRLMSRDG